MLVDELNDIPDMSKRSTSQEYPQPPEPGEMSFCTKPLFQLLTKSLLGQRTLAAAQSPLAWQPQQAPRLGLEFLREVQISPRSNCRQPM